VLVGAAQAVAATAAGDERFDGDPVADVEAPPLGRVDPDLVDDADGLVAGDERVAQVDDAVHLAPVLLDVGAAYAARLDPEDGVVAPDFGARQLDELDRACAGLHGRDDCARHQVGLVMRSGSS
jgi:hypothetical protein